MATPAERKRNFAMRSIKNDNVLTLLLERIEALEQVVVELTDVVESGNPQGRTGKLLAKLGIGKNV